MKNIKELRQRAKLSQEQLAAAVGVSRQSVSSWEAGVWPSAELVSRIAAALGCKIGDLFEDEENPGGASPSPAN